MVEIFRSGNLIQVRPIPPGLQKELTFKERVMLFGKELQVWRRIQLQQLISSPTNFRIEERVIFAVSPQGDLVCPAGLTSLVQGFLNRLGLPFTFTDLRTHTFPQADYARMFAAGVRPHPDQATILSLIATGDHGLIDYPTGGGKSFLMAALCLIYHMVPILIVVPGKAIAKTLHDYLMSMGIDPGICHSGLFTPRRVTIATPNSMLKLGQPALDEIRLLLCDEVYRMGATSAFNALSQVRHARMFGFADNPFARIDGRNLMVEALFGPVIFKSTYEEAVDRGVVCPVRVLRCQVDIPDFPANQLDPTQSAACRRKAFWHNDERNRAIAEAFLIGAAELGIPPEECQTLIMCETADHALNLKRFLPQFTVCHSGTDEKKRQRFLNRGYDRGSIDIDKKQLDAHQRAFEAGELKHVICTPVWSAGVNFTKLRLEIRADGQSSTVANIQLPGRLSRKSEDKQFGLVVDFADEFSPWTLARSKARFQQYAKRKWQIINHPRPLPSPRT